VRDTFLGACGLDAKQSRSTFLCFLKLKRDSVENSFGLEVTGTGGNSSGRAVVCVACKLTSASLYTDSSSRVLLRFCPASGVLSSNTVRLRSSLELFSLLDPGTSSLAQ